MLTKEDCNGLGILTNNPQVWYALEQAINGFEREQFKRLAIETDIHSIYRTQGRLEMLRMFKQLRDHVEQKRKE